MEGPCEAGHYCESGLDTPNPTDNDGHKGVGGVCPAGSYCPTGSAIPNPCEAGTFTASDGEDNYRLFPR